MTGADRRGFGGRQHHKGRLHPTYAVYRGDEIVTAGSAREVASAMGVTVGNVYSMCAPSRQHGGGRVRYVRYYEEEAIDDEQ